MPNKIQLLSDALANQIAAGEVIQRPASAVKELLENAIDAGSTNIKLIIKNAGKSLIQVIDNGCGMTETDARMSFEKHATSKIKNIDDLFAIRTKGFRGEALASVAAVAQVEMKTRVAESAIGTCIINEGTNILSQEPCQHAIGTSIAIKNLFFNIPARRSFLKSDNVEIKHIIDEFIRVSLAHSDIDFSMYSNDNELYHLKAGNLKKRVVALFGDKYAHNMVPLSEDTDVVNIKGYIGKPDYAKKTRGDQYIFVNNRFVKSAYLNHAIYRAYEDIIPKDRFPFFVLFIEVDPSKIDINVHPSKTEIKFENERVIYTFVNAATRHGLAQYSVTPTLDFDQEDAFNQMGTFTQEDKNYDPAKSAMSFQKTDFPFSKEEKNYNPFKKEGEYKRDVIPDWEDLYSIAKKDNLAVQQKLIPDETPEIVPASSDNNTKALQIANRFIMSSIKSGYILIDQQAAHQRILFERYLKAINGNKHASQKLLFPKNIELGGQDAEILRELLEDINFLGFEIQEFGNNTFVVHGLPADIELADEKTMLEDLLEQFKNNMSIVKLNKRESLIASLATKAGVKPGKVLSSIEMSSIIDELFSCQNPYTAPNGKKIFVKSSLEDIEKLFN
ncbi:MAG: DNA mismatch repair protein MutL [Planctomycetota bacterium]|jgi:DNA mismatch repair protein MutL